VLVLILRHRQQFDPRLFLPVVLESAIYALTMGTLILYGMGLLGIHPTLAVGPPAATEQQLGGPLTRIALSFGAGVNEELVFRLILLTLLVALFQKVLRLRPWMAVALGFLISSALFSAAHHVIGGEPWRMDVFVYRLCCGLFFAALYQWRGFAVAVYTHALYDVWVMVFH
jgi:membrane protease YdiL (CAAX protease family)